MSLRTRILLTLFLLLLPLSIIGLVRWVPSIEDLKYALVVIVSAWIIGLSLLYFFTQKLRGVYQDYFHGFLLISVFSFFPIAAGMIWVNQWVIWNHQITQTEVVTRFHPPGSDRIYLHLWDVHHLRNQAIALEDPASKAQPGDHIALTINKGLFGITYVNHAHIVR